MENTPSLGKKSQVCYKILHIHSELKGFLFFYNFCMTDKQLNIQMMKRWNEGGTEWMSDGVMQIIRGGGREAEEKPSEVCIKTVVSYSCCIRTTRKP